MLLTPGRAGFRLSLYPNPLGLGSDMTFRSCIYPYPLGLGGGPSTFRSIICSNPLGLGIWHLPLPFRVRNMKLSNHISNEFHLLQEGHLHKGSVELYPQFLQVKFFVSTISSTNLSITPRALSKWPW